MPFKPTILFRVYHYITLKIDNMKKVLLGIMAIAISFASIAQSESKDQKHHRKGGHKEYRHKGGKGFEDMNLTEDQKSKLKSINENFRTQVQSLRQDKSLSDEAQMQKRKSLHEEHRAQILALLTPEQKKQWEEKRKQHDFKGKDGKRFDKKDKSTKESKK
jgi:Spy/CpxP family protein refolding chaperone